MPPPTSLTQARADGIIVGSPELKVEQRTFSSMVQSNSSPFAKLPGIKTSLLRVAIGSVDLSVGHTEVSMT